MINKKYPHCPGLLLPNTHVKKKKNFFLKQKYIKDTFSNDRLISVVKLSLKEDSIESLRLKIIEGINTEDRINIHQPTHKEKKDNYCQTYI